MFVMGSERMPNGPSRSSKVVDFGTDRKCVCDKFKRRLYWSSVVTLDLGASCFRDIAGFMLRTTPPIFQPNFWGDPSVCISGYPLSGYPDLSVNFMAAKNPDILK